MKFCIKFRLINFEDDSIKRMDIKPKEYIFIFSDLNNGSVFDFNINKREIVIRKVIYKGFINLLYNSI